jgi:hypothetical protein
MSMVIPYVKLSDNIQKNVEIALMIQKAGIPWVGNRQLDLNEEVYRNFLEARPMYKHIQLSLLPRERLPIRNKEYRFAINALTSLPDEGCVSGNYLCNSPRHFIHVVKQIILR